MSRDERISQSIFQHAHVIGWIPLLCYNCGLFLQLFWAAYYGSEITAKSEDVYKCVCEAEWVKADISCKKTLIAILRMTSKPIKLTVAHIFHLNLETFVFVS